MLSVKTLLPVAALFCNALADGSYFFFTNQTSSFFSTVSKNCNKALTAPIPQCPQEILTLMGSNGYYTDGNDTVMDVLCSSKCPKAFASYRSNVTKACANDPQPEDGLPATFWVDAASSAFTQACLKDSKTGMYCTDFFNETFGDASDPTAVLGGYNKSALCSECIASLFKHQQSTPYSNYDKDSAGSWAAIQKECGYSYPTATPTLSTNVTSQGNYAPSGYPTASCVSGRTYTVASGDNCETIAEAQQVSYGAITTLNSLYPDCSNLWGGMKLCLPLKCTSYVVKSGDTCAAIANSTNVQFQEIISWNPTIDSYCLNLIAGQNICVGPPGGYQNFTTIPGATVTQTAIYATKTAARPSPVASGTTRKCGSYYQVQVGDYCQLVALNQTIALNLFEAINPSIDSGCSNLEAGVYYCVMPTADWNTTTTSTTVTAPTTTPSGTTADCYEYYTIQKNDNCATVENLYGISYTQLQYWNPSIDSACSNLALGEAYCVNGAPPMTATSTAPAATISTKKAATTSTKKATTSSTKAGTTSTKKTTSTTKKASTSTKKGTTSTKKSSTKKARRDEQEASPVKTAGPMITAGGVPYGWPGVGNERAMKQFGILEHAEL